MLHVTALTVWLPKVGNRKDEYEDAFWPKQPVAAVGDHFRFAVADGATETSYSGAWARQLVRSFGAGHLTPEQLDACLHAEQKRWLASVQRKPLPWYAAEKVLQGAYAAVLGLELLADHASGDGSADPGGAWRALSIGDCCLVHLRGDRRQVSFPAADADFFTSRPYLVSSSPLRNPGLAAQVASAGGSFAAGDAFLLMTDALAQWALQREDQGHMIWGRLRHAGSLAPAAATRLFDAPRRDGLLRNDDLTLTVIQTAAAPLPSR